MYIEIDKYRHYYTNIMGKKDNYKKEIEIFKENGSILRTSHAIKLGIYPRLFYEMEKNAVIEQVSRGLYKLVGTPGPSDPDLLTVSMKVPQGVICLTSALMFHNITSQIPHEVDVALITGARRPILEYPPVRYYWFSKESFEAGIETHKVDDIDVKVYSAEKTVADCFKFRNRIGLETAVEALKLCKSRKRASIAKIMKYAQICRVERIIKPYIEAII